MTPIVWFLLFLLIVGAWLLWTGQPTDPRIERIVALMEQRYPGKSLADLSRSGQLERDTELSRLVGEYVDDERRKA